MNKSAIKKALTCVTLAAATAGIWYGATRLSGRNIFLQQEVREEETLQDTEEEEEVPQDIPSESAEAHEAAAEAPEGTLSVAETESPAPETDL